jgi:hypothetical protein
LFRSDSRCAPGFGCGTGRSRSVGRVSARSDTAETPAPGARIIQVNEYRINHPVRKLGTRPAREPSPIHVLARVPLALERDMRLDPQRVRRANCGSHLTHRWREMDSNLRFRNRSVPISEQPVRLPSRLTASRPGTGSSNPFPSSAESAANLTRYDQDAENFSERASGRGSQRLSLSPISIGALVMEDLAFPDSRRGRC